MSSPFYLILNDEDDGYRLGAKEIQNLKICIATYITTANALRPLLSAIAICCTGDKDTVMAVYYI